MIPSQINKNIFWNIVNVVISITSGLLLVPILIDKLGNIAYGFVPLSLILTEYAGLIIYSINLALTKFITDKVHNNDYRAVNIIYSTINIFFLLFIFLQIIVLAIAISNINLLLTIPPFLENSVIYLIILTIISFNLTIYSGFLTNLFFAINRLDIIHNLNTLRVMARFILIIILISSYQNLLIIGLANIVSSLLVMLCTLYLVKQIFTELKINLKNYSVKDGIEIIKMSFWVLLNHMGSLLFLKSDIWIANKFIGPVSATNLGALNQLSSTLRSMVGILSSSVTPLIIIAHAKNENNKINHYLNMSIGFILITLTPLLSFISASADIILEQWLGKDYMHLSDMLFYLMFPLLFNLGILPVFSIFTAYNKVKLPAIITIIIGILNIITSIIILIITNLGLMGIIISGGLFLTLKNLIFSLFYASHIASIELKGIWFKIIRSIVIFIILFLILNQTLNYLTINNIYDLGLFFFIFITLCLPLLYYLLTNEEKKLLLKNINKIKVNT